MKTVGLSLIAALALGVAGARAQTNYYPVKLKGIVDIGTQKAQVTETFFTTNTLVLVLNHTEHRASLEEWDMTTTNQINVLVNRRRLALLPGGRFELITQNLSTDEQDGALRIAGKESPAPTPLAPAARKVNASITGVFNDADASGTNVDAVIKGKLISDGPPF